MPMARSPARRAYASALAASPAAATSAKWRGSAAAWGPGAPPETRSRPPPTRAGRRGDVAPGAAAVHTLDRLTDPPVQLQPGRDRQLLDQHLANQGVREAIPLHGPCLLAPPKGHPP